jgi:hypothetical protein
MCYELDPSLLGHTHMWWELIVLISDSFPLPQSPTTWTVHPERIVDASTSVRRSISEWEEQTNGSSLGGCRVAIALKASESELERFIPLLVFKNSQSNH